MSSRRSACAVVLAVVAACASDPAAPPAAEELTFEVLYVGSDALPIERGEDRLDALPEELVRAPVDVICLQGIGKPADRTKAIRALAKVYPASLDLGTDDATKVDDPSDIVGTVPPEETKPPCGGLEDEVNGILACLENSFCLESPGGRVAERRCLEIREGSCVTTRIFTLDPTGKCRSCLLGHALTGGTSTEARVRCLEKVHPLALGGEHGMLILSKLPLTRPSRYVLPAEGTRRAILGATVTTPRGKQIDVLCASVGPTAPSGLPNDPRPDEPYPGPYGSTTDGWTRENELQIEKLVAHVAARRGDRPAVVLGNFGASVQTSNRGGVTLPATGAVGARRLDEAFLLATTEDYVPGCTICLDNPLVPDFSQPSFHNRIYLAGLPRSAVRASTRSFLGPVVAAETSTFGVAQRVPISMQYGFRSKIAVGP